MTENLLWLDALAQQNKAVTVDPAKVSVQATASQVNGFAPMSDVLGGGVFWLTLGTKLDEEPRWNAVYPNYRDRYLRQFSQSESMVASAIYSMKTRIGTLNYEVNGPPRAKKFAQELVNNPSQGMTGDSFKSIVEKLSDDLDTSDNGAFMELWKPGKPDKAPPKGAPVLGFAHLDSRLCWRSFDPEFPVWYTNPVTGQIRKLHKDRVAYTADNPQPVELARGIGFCAVSRALRMVRVFRNMQIFVDEKVGGRFTRALGAISGVSAGQVKKALQNHQDNADSKGYVVYNDIPFLIDPSTEGKNDIKILLQDLASIPDGFNFRDDADLYAYILAFCWGVDAREFWPATQSGATKADATVQNMKARGRGIGNRIQTTEWLIRHALPESVEFEFDFSDDEQDELQAKITGMKLGNLSTMQRDGVINPMEYRAIAIAEGILDGKLLESLDLPIDSDSGAVETEETALEPNTNDSEVPGDNEGKVARKTESAFRKSLRQLVRGYWTGDLGAFDFYDGFANALERNLTKAWIDGMKQAGLDFSEITDNEQNRLRLEIATQIGYIDGLASTIAANSKANGGNLFPLYDRLELWVNNYGRISTLAYTLAAADQKAIWVYGDTIDHCPSCAAYAGLVYRNSVWTKWLEPLDMLPRGKGLACGGWQCDCSLKKTSEPVRPGRPPIVTKVHDHASSEDQRALPQAHANGSRLHEGSGEGGAANGLPRLTGLPIDHAHLEAQAEVRHHHHPSGE